MCSYSSFFLSAPPRSLLQRRTPELHVWLCLSFHLSGFFSIISVILSSRKFALKCRMASLQLQYRENQLKGKALKYASSCGWQMWSESNISLWPAMCYCHNWNTSVFLLFILMCRHLKCLLWIISGGHKWQTVIVWKLCGSFSFLLMAKKMSNPIRPH